MISTLVLPESLYDMAVHQLIFRAKFSLKDLADATPLLDVPITAPTAPPYQPLTVSLGQTIDQVVAILGQPEYEVDLGSKNIYV